MAPGTFVRWWYVATSCVPCVGLLTQGLLRVHSNLLLPSLLQAWRSAWSAWCWVLFQGALEPPRVTFAQNMCWETALQSACGCS